MSDGFCKIRHSSDQISLIFSLLYVTIWLDDQLGNSEKLSVSKEKASTTREQIIAAAYRVLAEQGYDAATIKAIAREAGVAPGLLHYYFASKDDLLIEVLKDISSRYMLRMQQLFRELPVDQLGKAGIAGALHRTFEEPEVYRLRYELFALGLRNPVLQPVVRSLLENRRQGIGQVAQSVTQGHDIDVEALTAILLATFDGLALQHLVDPNFDIERAYRTLSKMIDALLATT